MEQKCVYRSAGHSSLYREADRWFGAAQSLHVAVRDPRHRPLKREGRVGGVAQAAAAAATAAAAAAAAARGGSHAAQRERGGLERLHDELAGQPRVRGGLGRRAVLVGSVHLGRGHASFHTKRHPARPQKRTHTHT